MDDETIDIAVARAAVRRVMDQIRMNDPGADTGVVVDAAVRILASRQPGQITMLRAAEAVREALHSMNRSA